MSKEKKEKNGGISRSFTRDKADKSASGTKVGAISLSPAMTEEEAKKKEEEINEVINTIEKSRRRVKLWLVLAGVLVFLLLAVIHYYTVMQYAVLSDLHVSQSANMPERINFSHTVTSGGKISYYYGETQLINYVRPDSNSEWSWAWNTEGDRIYITVRSRWLVFPKWNHFTFEKRNR